VVESESFDIKLKGQGNQIGQFLLNGPLLEDHCAFCKDKAAQKWQHFGLLLSSTNFYNLI
jgi:hypothetical protein